MDEKFYVIDNMYQGRRFNLEKFDTLEDAVTRFNEVRNDRGTEENPHRVSAIGFEKGSFAIDMLHDFDGFLIHTDDVKKHEFNIDDIRGKLDSLIPEKQYEYFHGRLGDVWIEGHSCIFIHEYHKEPFIDSYANDKMLLPKDIKSPISAINEVNVSIRNYEEWRTGEDARSSVSVSWSKLNDLIPYTDGPILINQINVSYVEPFHPLGSNQADLSPSTVNEMLDDFNMKYQITYESENITERVIYASENLSDVAQKYYDVKKLMPGSEHIFCIGEKSDRFKTLTYIDSPTFGNKTLEDLSKEIADKFGVEIKDTPEVEIINTKINRRKGR